MSTFLFLMSNAPDWRSRIWRAPETRPAFTSLFLWNLQTKPIVLLDVG
jgi:hypothetical protein